MTCRAKIQIIDLSLMPILILASAGSKSAQAQAKLDSYYTATLLGLPIGHISCAVDLKENRFSSVATGSIAGFLRLFLDAQGSVAAEGRLSNGKPVASKFQLKLWEVNVQTKSELCLAAIGQKNLYSQHLLLQAQTTCRSKTVPVIR